jgi:hypothetical protein
MYWLGDVGIGVAAVATGAVVLPRYLWFRRRPLPRGCTHLTLPASGTSPRLEVAHLASGHRDVAIVAHGFLKSMRTPALVSTMLALSKQMDVLALDFAPATATVAAVRAVSFRAAADDLGGWWRLAREMGYERIGVVGYSMGAGPPIPGRGGRGANLGGGGDIAPARGPSRRPALNDQAVGPLRWWMALMGTRVAPRLQRGCGPRAWWPGWHRCRCWWCRRAAIHSSIAPMARLSLRGQGAQGICISAARPARGALASSWPGGGLAGAATGRRLPPRCRPPGRQRLCRGGPGAATYETIGARVGHATEERDFAYR